MGHAKVYHWYKEELKGTGLITLKFANNLALPLDSTNPEDTVAALRYQDYILGIIANPIFLGEQYPESVLSTHGINLTKLTHSELAYINGTADFWSFDPYTAGFATSPPGGINACASNKNNPLWPTCVVGTNVQQDGWLNGAASFAYAYIAPQYVRQQLGYCWNVFRYERQVFCSQSLTYCCCRKNLLTLDYVRPKGILIAEFGFSKHIHN